jgi:hypothetical protein
MLYLIHEIHPASDDDIYFEEKKQQVQRFRVVCSFGPFYIATVLKES